MNMIQMLWILLQLYRYSISRNVIVLVRVSFYNRYVMLHIVVIGLKSRIREIWLK